MMTNILPRLMTILALDFRNPGLIASLPSSQIRLRIMQNAKLA